MMAMRSAQFDREIAPAAGVMPTLGRRLLVVHNPAAGARRERFLQEVVQRLRDRCCDVELCRTQSLDENLRLVRSAVEGASCDMVVAAGGDGTVRAVASAVMGSGMPLGIIPIGTGNVMAHEIGLRSNPEAIADCLVDGRIARVRAAYANGKPFFLMVGAGFDGRVTGWLDTAAKRRLGKLAYGWPMIRGMIAGPDDLIVRVDGVEHRAAWAVATLGQHYAGGFMLAPQAHLQAGNIHAVMFKARGRISLLRQIAGVAAGRVAYQIDIEQVAATTVEITAPEPVPVQIDGESFGTTPVEIRTNGPILELVVPRGASAWQLHAESTLSA